MAYEVDRLEIVIETATQKANKELDKLISKLNQVSTSLRSVASAAQQINKVNNAISKSALKANQAGAATQKMAQQIRTSSDSIVNSSAIERMELEKKYRVLNTLLSVYSGLNKNMKMIGMPMPTNGDTLSLQVGNASDQYRQFTEQAYQTHQAEQENMARTRAAWQAFIEQMKEAFARINLMSETYSELNAKVADYDGAVASAMNAVVKLRGATEEYRVALEGVTDVTNLSQERQAEIAEAYKKVANAASEAAAAQEILKAAETQNNAGFGMSSLIGKDINKEMAQFNAEYTKVRYNAAEVNQEIEKHKTGFNGTNNSLLKLRRTLLNILSLVYVIRKGWNYINKALDFGETINLFQTVFRKIGLDAGEQFEFAFLERAEEFRDTLANVLSLDPNEIMNYMANFTQMANSMGLVSESAYRISESLTLLGADVASLFNIDIDSAMERLKAGLSGQIRPMRMLGVDISKTSLQMIALKYGITDSIETMDAAAKVQLRYLAMTEQLTIAMGDMARTLDSPANQLRILQQQWTNFSRTLGTVFVPMITKILPILNGLVMALGSLTGSLAEVAGYSDPDFTDETIYALEGLDDAADEADDTLQKLKATLGGFDELNILSTSGGVEDKTGSGYATLDEAILKSNEAYMKALNEQIGLMNDKAKEWQNRFKTILPIILSVSGAVLGLTLAIKGLAAIGGLYTAFTAAGGGLKGLTSAIPLLGKLAAGFKGIGVAIKAVGAGIVAHPVVAVIAAIVAILVLLYKTNEDFRNSVNNLFKQFQPVIDALVNGFKTLWNSLMPIFMGLKDTWQEFGTILAKVIEFITPVITLFANQFAIAITFIMNALAGIIDFLVAVFSGDWDAAWAAIMGIFEDYWNALVDTFNNIATFFAPIIDWVVNAVKVAWEAIGSFFEGVWQFLLDGWNALWKGIETGINLVINLIASMIEGVIVFFIRLFTEPKELLKDIIQFAVDTFENFKTIIGNIVNGIINFFKPLGNFFGSMWDGLVDGLVKAWEFIKNIFKGIGDWFGDLGSGIGKVFKDLINKLIDGINAVMEAPFNAINGILSNIKGISILGAKPFDWVGTVPVPQIPKLADGGIVDYGQLFVAREAGPELVGGFGNKTGVMNNEQIVEAVSAGVAEAVAQVMSQVNFGSDGERNINVFLDGRQITSAVEQNRRQRGVSIARGGNK
jgi:phage-related protein